MYGVAARKKIGKTILLGSLSHNLNASEVPHLFIGLEMSAEEIEQRNIARDMRFNSIKFLTSDRQKVRDLVGTYAATVPDNMIFEHRPGLTFDELRRMIARHTQHGIAGIFLDYWQLVGGRRKGETEEQHLRDVAQFLADVARKENVFVVIAAQVNQEGNTRGGEGLKLACDMYLHLHREKDAAGAWLEMEESRFTRYIDVGTESMAGIWLHKRGPYFSEHAPPSADYEPHDN
jgi:replicative DNA helicase